MLHWINAFAMILMIMSGWQIYNASPLFNFKFSASITLGGWLGGALQWHFAAMWLLMVNGLVYLTLGLVTGRFRKKLLPITPAGVIADTRAALTGKLSHADLTTYNYVQKLLYAGIILVGILIVLSGLSIWKPVQLQYLTALFGGYDFARYVHFVCDGRDRRVPGRPCRAGAAGAEEPARHDHRPLRNFEEHTMGRIRKPADPRRRQEAADQGRHQTDARPVAPPLYRRAEPASAR